MITTFGGAEEPFRLGYVTLQGELAYEGQINRAVVASFNAQFPASVIRIHSKIMGQHDVMVVPLKESEEDPIFMFPRMWRTIQDPTFPEGFEATASGTFADKPAEEHARELAEFYKSLEQVGETSGSISAQPQPTRPKLSVVTDETEGSDQPLPPRPTGGFKPRIVK